MKQISISAVALCLLLVVSANVCGQDSEEPKSKKAVAADVAGKVAKETGKAAVKITVITAKATAKHVVVPVAKVVWDPVLKKAVPKVLGETAKLAGKGIKNGFKLIFKRDDSKSTATAGT
jgi:hypothetical protein